MENNSNNFSDLLTTLPTENFDNLDDSNLVELENCIDKEILKSADEIQDGKMLNIFSVLYYY